MPQRYRTTIAYDGSAYAGWQVQPAARTVQGVLEKAVHEFSGEKPKVHSSGRTDQGVHAKAQVAHFDLEKAVPPARMKEALNALLPEDIRVLRVANAAPSFHARRSAVSKEYRYFIWNSTILPPFLRRYRTHIRRKLDVADMNAAADYLVGTHDFASFTANPNRLVESTVRTLTKLRVVKKGNEIMIVAASNGFLYKMVRSLCGFLIRVGEGDVPPEETRRILDSRVRTARVPTAPPQGLFLWRVTY